MPVANRSTPVGRSSKRSRAPSSPANHALGGVQPLCIGRERHASTFASNEIDGPLLLELGLDDLDYMEVKVLAHRKALLKGVADLKRVLRHLCDMSDVSASILAPRSIGGVAGEACGASASLP